MPSLRSGISSAQAQKALESLGFVFFKQIGGAIALKRIHPTQDEDIMILPIFESLDRWVLGYNLKKANVDIDDFLAEL